MLVINNNVSMWYRQTICIILKALVKLTSYQCFNWADYIMISIMNDGEAGKKRRGDKSGVAGKWMTHAASAVWEEMGVQRGRSPEIWEK